ncbi:uncharacterized protein [Mobula birostris]|uniref:uncharacterized protein n=1 Tax=Mobula birostris TaxID=1983395 RepID=UPI003B2862E6
MIIGGYNLDDLRYKDDTVLIVTSKEKFRGILDKVIEESAKCGLTISREKTKCVIAIKKIEIQKCELKVGCLILESSERGLRWSALATSHVVSSLSPRSDKPKGIAETGENLDNVSCEALEEIFRQIQFKMISLEWAKLDEDGASALFDMMEYYDSTLCLRISFSRNIGTRGWMAAAQLIQKSNSLQEFEASGIPLMDNTASCVARGLKANHHLRVLRLDNARLSGRSLMLLVCALKMNQVLRELYLADNNLNCVQDSMHLRDLLQVNCTIQLLDLKNNCIFNTGLEDICEGLKGQKQGLKTLILWNNKLTHKGITHLAAILPNLTSLETLNLGRNPLSNEGVHRLKEGLIANRSVTRLGLASTAITCEGAIAMAEFIVESTGILRLDLRRNRIRTGGLMALTLAMKLNNSLVQLDLDKGPMGEKFPHLLGAEDDSLKLWLSVSVVTEKSQVESTDKVTGGGAGGWWDVSCTLRLNERTNRPPLSSLLNKKKGLIEFK